MADTIVVFVLTRHWVLGASYDCPRLVHCARSHNQLGRLDLSQVCSLLLSCSHHVKELCCFAPVSGLALAIFPLPGVLLLNYTGGPYLRRP